MSTPSTPDYRIRFPAPTINFGSEVGLTGQTHDNYPAPNSQLRFDWMRLYLLGLLSNQASYHEPTQFREGTLWLDLNGPELRIRQNDEWASLASVINVQPQTLNTDAVTLLDMFERLKEVEERLGLARISPSETGTTGSSEESSGTGAVAIVPMDFGITLENDGSVVTTGLRGPRRLNSNCKITDWFIDTDVTTTLTADIYRNGTKINPSPITLTSGTSNHSSSLTNWTILLTKGDAMTFDILSNSAATKVTITILGTVR